MSRAGHDLCGAAEEAGQLVGEGRRLDAKQAELRETQQRLSELTSAG
ncbi:hypothetical protein [Aeromicrobium piscarium]|nr:hypothetical protein [Aeromicrobium piscarium]